VNISKNKPKWFTLFSIIKIIMSHLSKKSIPLFYLFTLYIMLSWNGKEVVHAQRIFFVALF
jgi:hypothetical protein